MSPHQTLARDVFRELIETDTTHSSGSTTAAAEGMAARLRDAGMPDEDVRVIGPLPHKGNLVARLRGSGARAPLLLLAHLDVVDARREDWTVDPFTFLERGGWFYGRGTTDDKAMAAIWMANLLRFAREGWVPDRDIILALTADEEGGTDNGAAWLLQHHRNLVEAAYGLNEGGYGRLQGGHRIANQVQASEKVYLDFQLEATGHGGHSSLPSASPDDGAIHRLSRALVRLAAFRFPVTLDEVTRAFFRRMAELLQGALADDMRAVASTPTDAAAADRLAAVPYFNALMRTTCAPTRLEAAEDGSTIPRRARALVNCRLLPGESPAAVRAALVAAIADDRIDVQPLGDAAPSPPSPLAPEVIGPIERITAELWPGTPLVPVMSVGATDSRHFRRAGIPMYGVSGLFLDVDDVRAHGPDERIGVEAFYEGLEFLHRLVRALA